jgi:hypothetical protein
MSNERSKARNNIADVFSGQEKPKAKSDVTKITDKNPIVRVPEKVKPVTEKAPYNRYLKTDVEGVYNVRLTTIIGLELHIKATELAFWEHSSIQEIINDAVQRTIDEYEAKNGTLKKIPPGKAKKNLAYDREVYDI